MMKSRSPVKGLGERLKAAREAAGITQEDAANSLGVVSLTMRRWEHNQNTPPVGTLYAMAKLYGKPFLWFVEDAEGKRIAESPAVYVVNDEGATLSLSCEQRQALELLREIQDDPVRLRLAIRVLQELCGPDTP